MIYALHGNLGSVEDWQVGRGIFSEGSLVTVDLWGEVKSSAGFEASSFGWCASVATDEKHLLVGYSLGGRLALHALLQFPDYWSRAVIVSAHPGLPDEHEKAARREKDRLWAERARNGQWENFLSDWNGQPVFGGATREEVVQRQRELQSCREEIARGFEIWSLGHQQNLGPELANCPVPVLWVTGANDEKFSNIAAGMADVMPQGEHLAIEDCGHRVLAEAPKELVTAIGDFQKRIL